MGGKAPKPPKPPPEPPPTPVEDPAAKVARDLAGEEERRKRGGGRQSTILTSPLGVTGAAPVSSKVLLGS